MPTCFYCKSTAACWGITDEKGNTNHYCDPCFTAHDLAAYKKKMDEFHRTTPQHSATRLADAYTTPSEINCQNFSDSVRQCFSAMSAAKASKSSGNLVQGTAALGEALAMLKKLVEHCKVCPPCGREYQRAFEQFNANL
jgi:hypothetical protein